MDSIFLLLNFFAYSPSLNHSLTYSLAFWKLGELHHCYRSKTPYITDLTWWRFFWQRSWNERVAQAWHKVHRASWCIVCERSETAIRRNFLQSNYYESTKHTTPPPPPPTIMIEKVLQKQSLYFYRYRLELPRLRSRHKVTTRKKNNLGGRCGEAPMQQW